MRKSKRHQISQGNETTTDSDRLFIPIKNKALQEAILNYKDRTGDSYEKIMLDNFKIPMNDLDMLLLSIEKVKKQFAKMSRITQIDKIELMFSNIKTVFSLMSQNRLDSESFNNYIVKYIEEETKKK